VINMLKASGKPFAALLLIQVMIAPALLDTAYEGNKQHSGN
jgi:hypothetical protein